LEICEKEPVFDDSDGNEDNDDNNDDNGDCVNYDRDDDDNNEDVISPHSSSVWCGF
jgi:hypothetical protein